MEDYALNRALSEALNKWKPPPDTRDWGTADCYEQNPQPRDWCSDGNDMLELLETICGGDEMVGASVEIVRRGEATVVVYAGEGDLCEMEQDTRAPRAVAVAAAKHLRVWKDGP